MDLKFQGFDEWISKKDIKDKGIIILYPGGFRPIHGGHISLIRRYSDLPEVKKIVVLVGPKNRDGIDQDKAVKIAERLTSDIDKVIVEKVYWPSPILTAYKIIGDASPGYYALAASAKGEDYKRVKDFVFKHSKGNKFSREDEGVYVIEFPINTDPLVFMGRNDNHEGEPISASVLRNDIINNDFNNFKTGYPNSSIDDIKYVWNELKDSIIKEALNVFGDHSLRFLEKSKNEYYNNFKGRNIFEGGAAGHLISPWEARDMTFKEIRQLILDALNGKLQNVTEKLDGQNIMVTFKNGNVYLARTEKQMKNKGELAIRWDKVYESLSEKTPERIKKAFQQALNDVQTIMTYGDTEDLNDIFKNGYRWLNMELLNPETENIVPYGQYQIRIHNIREVDDNGKEVDVIWEGRELDKIIDHIEEAQRDKKLKKLHLIKKTNKVNFEKIADIESIKEDLIQRLQNIMDKNNLDDDNNIGDYISEELRNWLSKKIEDPDLIETLIQRWVYGVKTKNISNILKDIDPNIGKWIKEEDERIDDRIGELLDPIIEIFSRLGIAVLKNLSGIAANNKDKVSEGIRRKAEDAIEKIKEYISKKDVKDVKDFEKKIKYLETQLRRIEQAGGLEGIAPLEGIVFEYNGRIFKLTGIYLPILKIINFFEFGKDK